jgi:hypothetical protein
VPLAIIALGSVMLVELMMALVPGDDSAAVTAAAGAALSGGLWIRPESCGNCLDGVTGLLNG